MKLTDITFVIAVRKGSKRVKNKNIKKFANSSLLKIKLDQISRCFPRNKIFLSTDCQNSLRLAKKYNCEIDLRPKKYCTDNIRMKEVYSYLAKKIDTNFICYLHVTSPLLKDSTLKRAIKIFISSKEKLECLASVTKVKEYLWHKGKAINYDYKNHPRSQDLVEYFSLNFAINIIKTKIMAEEKLLVKIGYKPFIIDYPENIDIDNLSEFQFAEYLYNKIYIKQ